MAQINTGFSPISKLILYLCSMISKARMKFVRALEHKKARRQEGLFVAEGPKVVGDLLTRFRPHMLIATPEWLHAHRHDAHAWQGAELCDVTEDELRKASFLQHPQQVIGVFPMPEPATETADCPPTHELCLALDGVQDPGNLGTIIRMADWFGIEHIYCSEETADAYNPKAVQATMGSIARVELCYTDLPAFIGRLPADCPVYGTLLDGTDIYREPLSPTGLIVMGNEGNGISPAVRRLVTRRLLIPNYPPTRETADSLNVAIATALVCGEFRRRCP